MENQTLQEQETKEVKELNEHFVEFLKTKGICAKFKLAFHDMAESTKKQHQVDVESFKQVKEKSIEDLLIKGLFKSKSNLAIINVCDILSKNDDYRMNAPSTTNDRNWCYRLTDFKDLFKQKNKYLKLNTKTNRL